MKGLTSCFPIFILCTLHSCLQILYTSHDCSWRCLKGGEANIRRIIWSFSPFFLSSWLEMLSSWSFMWDSPRRGWQRYLSLSAFNINVSLYIYTHQTQIEFPLAPHFSCIKMRASPRHTHTFTHVAARHFSSYLWQESISKAYLELRPHRNGSNVPLICFVPFCVTDSRIFPTSSTFAARKRFKHQPLPWISTQT